MKKSIKKLWRGEVPLWKILVLCWLVPVIAFYLGFFQLWTPIGEDFPQFIQSFIFFVSMFFWCGYPFFIAICFAKSSYIQSKCWVKVKILQVLVSISTTLGYIVYAVVIWWGGIATLVSRGKAGGEVSFWKDINILIDILTLYSF